MKHCDSVVVEEKGLSPVVTLKTKSGNEGSHGKSKARSFAEEKIQYVLLLLNQKIGVDLGKIINKMCLYKKDQETNEGCSSVDGDLSYIELLLQVSAFANTRNLVFCCSVGEIGASDSELFTALYTT